MTSTKTVVIQVQLTVEVDASSDEQAFMGIFETFEDHISTDSLSGVEFATGSHHCGPTATIKTCVVEDIDFQYVDNDWKLWLEDHRVKMATSIEGDKS